MVCLVLDLLGIFGFFGILELGNGVFNFGIFGILGIGKWCV